MRAIDRPSQDKSIQLLTGGPVVLLLELETLDLGFALETLFEKIAKLRPIPASAVKLEDVAALHVVGRQTEGFSESIIGMQNL